MLYNEPRDTVKVSYRNDKEREFYEDFKALKATHGKRMAEKIIDRIGDLIAAATPQHLPRSARFHEHQGRRKGLYSVDLVHPQRLIVEPTCSYDSYVQITEVMIYEVFNPHK